jgi:hypothetical protein
MGDTDLRDALARRLQKTAGDSSPAAKISATFPMNATRGLPPLPRGGNNPVIFNTQDTAVNRVDGFLYKYSSGPISRWQKRYFILENCKLNYYKRVPVDPSSAQPNKTFSIRRIKQVKVPNDEELEFSLVFSNDKSYAMRAPSMDEMRRWISALRSAIELSEKLALENPNASLDDGDGMSDNDGMISANGSVFSDSSPKNLAMSPSSKTVDETASGTGGRFSNIIHGLIPRRESLSLHRSHPSTDSDAPTAGAVAHAPWSIDIEQLALDKNFEEWFYFVPNSIPSPRSAPGSPRRRSSVPLIREIRMTHVIDGCTRASNHMWCAFAGLPRGTDMRLEEAIGKAKHRIHGPLALGNANTLVEEYVARIVKYVGLSLDVRFASSHHNVAELPSLMECIAKFTAAVDRLIPLQESPCVCCYCDPSGTGLLKLEKNQNRKSVACPPPVCCSNEKWRKNFRSLLQRLGGELEVGLIEELHQIITSAESVWNMPSIEPGAGPSRHNSLSSDQATAHGPSLISHPLLDDMNHGKASQTVTVSILMTSFSVSLVQAAQSKCLNASHQWMAAYPLAARLVAEHSSSALVAAMNSVCRQFKRNCMSVSQNEESVRKLTESAKQNRIEKWRKISACWSAPATSQYVQAVASVKSSKLSSTDEVQPTGVKPKQELTLFTSIEHLVAFINECVLISRFCAKTWSNGVSSKFTPAVFLTCMDGLSGAFLSSAVEASLSLVKLHFHPVTRLELARLFGPKLLVKSTTSPMTSCKETTDVFLAAISSLHPLPCVKEAVVQIVAQFVVHDYLTGLIKNRPKLKTFKTLPELIAHDSEIYRDFFGREHGVQKIALDANLVSIDKVVEMLNETNAFSFTIHLNTVSKVVGSTSAAFAVISGVLKMKEHEYSSSSKLKKDVASMVNSMKQQVAQGEDSSNACCGENDDESTTVDASSVETANAKRGKTNAHVKLNVNQVKITWDFDE